MSEPLTDEQMSYIAELAGCGLHGQSWMVRSLVAEVRRLRAERAEALTLIRILKDNGPADDWVREAWHRLTHELFPELKETP